MKAEITEKGVFDGAGDEYAIGDTVEVKGDALPSALVGKARVVNAKSKKADKMVVNPADKKEG